MKNAVLLLSFVFSLALASAHAGEVELVYIDAGLACHCKSSAVKNAAVELSLYDIGSGIVRKRWLPGSLSPVERSDASCILRFPLAWSLSNKKLRILFPDLRTDAVGRIAFRVWGEEDVTSPHGGLKSAFAMQDGVAIYNELPQRGGPLYVLGSEPFALAFSQFEKTPVNIWYALDDTNVIARLPFATAGSYEWRPCTLPSHVRWEEVAFRLDFWPVPNDRISVWDERVDWSQDVSPDGFSPIGSVHLAGKRISCDDPRVCFPKDAEWLIWEQKDAACRLSLIRVGGWWSVCKDAPRKDAPKIVVVNNDEKSVFLSYSQEFDTSDVSNSLKRILFYLKEFEKNSKGEGGEPVRSAAEISLEARLRKFHALRARRETMHYREYNREMERQWEEFGRILCEVQKEVARGEVSGWCKALFRDDVIAFEATGRMLPGLRKLTVREQKKALGALMSATDAKTRAEVLVTLLFSDLPLEAFKEDSVQSCLVSILRDGRMAGGALYSFVEDSRWGDVVDCARNEASRFDPRVGDSDGNLCALLSMSALTRHGDKSARGRLSRCFKERKLESNRDLFFLCPILLLARDEMLAKDVLGLITGDQRVRWFGEDCVPSAMSFAHAAASACSQLIVGFPQVSEYRDYEGEAKEAAEKWVAENRKCVVTDDFRRCFKADCRFGRECGRCQRDAACK